MTDRRLMDVNELSAYMGVSVNTLYGWVSMRKIPYIKAGRLLRFDPQDIESWIADNKRQPMVE